MAYPLPTNLESCDGLLYCLLDWANSATNGLFVPAVLLGMVIVLIISTQRFGSARSLGFSFVIGAIGAMWLATAQLMQWWLASGFILLGAVGITILLLNEK